MPGEDYRRDRRREQKSQQGADSWSICRRREHKDYGNVGLSASSEKPRDG
jgi:hypothetical protein